MRTEISILMIALASIAPLHAETGTSLDSSQIVIPSAVATAQAVKAASAFRFDVSMAPAAIEPTLGPGEQLQLVDVVAGREHRESASWHYEFDPKAASFLLQRREGVATPVGAALPRETLEQAVLLDVQKRLGDLGIVSAETQPPRIRAVRRAVKSEGTAPRDEVIGYKAFVSRSLGGVVLPESTLAFSYTTDGSFRRMYGRWPELAADGHKLTTTLTREEIAAEVAAQLQPRLAGQELAAPVPVRLVYVEEPVGDGSVRLRLEAEGTILPASTGRFTQPSAELVPLSR